jgi:photosystem II stability/assembly factor-like uncharacterized protein
MSFAGAVFAFQDPVDTPATPQLAVGSAMLSGIAQAGKRQVAVGARGVIAVSADEGLHWAQVASPVSSDLVAVQFIDADNGWVTGHDGVVLRSRDGGLQWAKLTDGRKSIAQMKAFYAARVAQGDAPAQAAVKLLDANGGAGGDLPWLSLWFRNERSGFIVGPFGMIAATDDAGVNWQPWLDRIDNPEGLHLNAIRQVGADLFIAAEKGVVFKLNRAQGRFVRLHTGYEGTFFGITGDAARVLAFGLRGTCYQSTDGGANWERVQTSLTSGVAAGAMLPDGRAVLVAQGGQVAVADNSQGNRFAPVPISRAMPFSDVLPLPANRLMVVGLAGAAVLSVTPNRTP